MQSFTARRQQWQDITNASDPNTQSLGDRLMNQSEKRILASKDWPFLEKEDLTLTTVAGQQFYQLPQLNGKFKSIYITVGTFRWVPRLITLRDEWDRINLIGGTSYKSDFPVYFYIFGGQVGIWPTPQSSSNQIGLIYKLLTKDLSIVDYTTGTIVSVANAGTAVVGSGTTWTQAMQGRYLQITDSNTANKGDGFWYQIATSTITATTLSLVKPYTGLAISAGSAAYTIGQMSAFPEGYTDLPVWDAARQYFATVSPDATKFKLYDGLFKELYKQMDDEQADKQSSPVLDDGEGSYNIANPNLMVNNPGP